MYKVLGTVLFCLTIWSCTDDDYLLDTGLHEANYEGTIWDYLNDKPVHFDSLTKVIELAGMEELFIEDSITFFAPSNPSINRSLYALNENLYRRGRDTVSDLGQVNGEVWRELLSNYIIKGKYLARDIPQLDTTQLDAFGGQGFISLSGRPMNLGVVYFDAGGVQYAGYRQLYFSYINEFSNDEDAMINVPVASSDIQPYNGAVHVLRYQEHSFGFRASEFVSRAISAGIREEEDD